MSKALISVSPIDGEILWQGVTAGEADVRQCMNTAATALADWRSKSIEERVAIVRRFGAELTVPAVHRLGHQEPQNQRGAQQEPCRRVQPQKLRFGEINQCPVQVAGRLFTIIHEHKATIAKH